MWPVSQCSLAMAAKCKAAAQEANAKEMEPQRKGQQKLGKAAPAKAQVSLSAPLGAILSLASRSASFCARRRHEVYYLRFWKLQ